MTTEVWVRPLSPEETAYLRKTEFGKATVTWGHLSILGPASYSTVRRRHQAVSPQWTELGNLGLQDVSAGYQPASGGEKFTLQFYENATNHTRIVVEELRMPVLSETYAKYAVFYFASRYTTSLLRALTYADNCVATWQRNRSFLDRTFGGDYLLVDAVEARTMRAEIQKILSAA